MKNYSSKYVALALFICISVTTTCFGFFEIHNKSKFSVELNKSGEFMNDSIIGIWSGKHITLEISNDEATVEYDCATGKIDGKIKLDKKNNFRISGKYLEERGGPVRLGEQSKAVKVKFTGQIKGRKMNLTVSRNDTQKLIGKFTLYYGREPYLVKCR